MREPRDRRRDSRRAVDSPAVIWWEEGLNAYQVKGKALNISGGGVFFRSKARWKPDTIVWCAVPAYNIYTRAVVCHCRGFWSTETGLKMLAGPLRTAPDSLEL